KLYFATSLPFFRNNGRKYSDWTHGKSDTLRNRARSEKSGTFTIDCYTRTWVGYSYWRSRKRNFWRGKTTYCTCKSIPEKPIRYSIRRANNWARPRNGADFASSHDGISENSNSHYGRTSPPHRSEERRVGKEGKAWRKHTSHKEEALDAEGPRRA